MAKQIFTTGQVLTAAQMTSLQQTAMGGGAASAKTASYVLVAADAGTAITMTSGSATTITVNTGLFSAGDSVQIINLGAGTCTITAGTASVSTAGSLILSQYESGFLYFTATGTAIFNDYVQAGGGGKVLQVIQSSITSATTIATTTLTDTGITATITPSAASSKVLIMIVGHVGLSRTDRQFGTNRRIVRDSTTIFTQGEGSYGFVFPYSSTSNNIEAYQQLSSIYLDSPSTTSATTYKLQANLNQTTASLTSTWQQNSYPSTITLMEIGA